MTKYTREVHMSLLHKKRIILLLGLFCLLVASPATAGNLSYDVNVKVDCNAVNFPDQKPFIETEKNRTYVPVRFVTEKLGAKVDWDEATQTAIVKKENKVVKATVNDNNPTVNGDTVSLDAPVILMNGRSLVPLRFMSEVMGSEIKWDGTTRTVYIGMEEELARCPNPDQQVAPQQPSENVGENNSGGSSGSGQGQQPSGGNGQGQQPSGQQPSGGSQIPAHLDKNGNGILDAAEKSGGYNKSGSSKPGSNPDFNLGTDLPNN
ncbi:MAG: copper amine oxidase N-terminal domain-containing protein [Firmicutes bacterium]|nr:copper amine oxidase N-terminal domain-containing protein [Bacillota bacterium]